MATSYCSNFSGKSFAKPHPDYTMCSITEPTLSCTPSPAGLAQGQSLINGAVSGALTGMFAFVAGSATDSGVLRGAGLGLIAGAVVSVEALERAREMWKSALERLGVSMSAGNVPPATVRMHMGLLEA